MSQHEKALIAAARAGDVEGVKAALAAGADIHSSTDGALCFAADFGHAEVVGVLLASGSHIHASDDAALCWSASQGHAEVVRILLAGGADIHARCDAALRWAALEHHEATVRVLLAAGADPVVALQNVGGGDEVGDVVAMLDACADMLPTAQHTALMAISPRNRFVRLQAMAQSTTHHHALRR